MAYKLGQEIKNYILDVSRPAMNDGKLDVKKLCKDLGIEAYNFEFKNPSMSGAIFYDRENNNWKIYVNNNDSPRRKRFTIAHEIGHYISFIKNSLSKNYIDNQPDGTLKDHAIMARAIEIPTLSSKERQAELEANEIAAELLMPENQVRNFVEEGKNVEQMADCFEVSESAMTIRLLNLDYKILEAPANHFCENLVETE
jgi:Zn-dependent peptidase ImmA (M78 family)